MGSVATTCTCDGETKAKLDKQKKENQELKRQLIGAQKHKKDAKQLQSQQNKQITQLNEEKNKAFHQLQSEQKVNKELQNKYVTEKERNKQLKRKADSLFEQIKSLKQKCTTKDVDQKTIEDEALSIQTTNINISDVKSRKIQQKKFEELASIKRDDLIAAQSIVINQDIIILRDYLVRKPLNEKDLKTKLSTFLTERNETLRVNLIESYNERYIADIMDDVSRIINKGNVLELIGGLFRTKVGFDAVCINDIVVNRASKAGAIEVGSILCCRNINELKLICYQYKRLYGADMKDDIHKVSSDKLYQSMVHHLFTFTRNDNETTNKVKIKAKIQGDVEYLKDKSVKRGNFDHKKKVALMMIGNTEMYIEGLNKLYFQETGANLVDFIDDKFGEKTLVANWMKLRIEYCSDRADFYARKIHIAGEDGWNKTRAKEINWVFISMFGDELRKIQKKFDEFNYGDDKSMVQWIKEKCPHARYADFLIKMLENCSKQSLCMV